MRANNFNNEVTQQAANAKQVEKTPQVSTAQTNSLLARYEGHPIPQQYSYIDITTTVSSARSAHVETDNEKADLIKNVKKFKLINPPKEDKVIQDLVARGGDSFQTNLYIFTFPIDSGAEKEFYHTIMKSFDAFVISINRKIKHGNKLKPLKFRQGGVKFLVIPEQLAEGFILWGHNNAFFGNENFEFLDGFISLEVYSLLIGAKCESERSKKDKYLVLPELLPQDQQPKTTTKRRRKNTTLNDESHQVEVNARSVPREYVGSSEQAPSYVSLPSLDYTTQAQQSATRIQERNYVSSQNHASFFTSPEPELLVQLSESIDVKVEKSKSNRFSIQDEGDIKKFMEEENKLRANNQQKLCEFEITQKSKDYIESSLFIAHVAAIDSWGLYTTENIKPNDKPITLYVGQQQVFANDSEEEINPNSLYKINITNADNEFIGCIDGQDLRNEAAYINHNEIANCEAIQEKNGNAYVIKIYVRKEIPAFQQLTMNYGPDYWVESLKAHNLTRKFIHASDNWETDSEIFDRNKQHYLPGTYAWQKHIIDSLCLNYKQFLIPNTFPSIIDNNPNALKDILQTTKADLLAYSVEEDTMLPANAQSHLTALMLACYLGRVECVIILLSHGADVNRQHLLTGQTALHICLQGRGSIAEKNEIANLLILHMQNVSILDKNNLSIFHYIIQHNMSGILKNLMDAASKQTPALIDQMYAKPIDNQNKHLTLEDCINDNQWDIFEALLDYICEYDRDETLHDLIEAKEIFTEKFFAGLTKEQASEALDILKRMQAKYDYVEALPKLRQKFEAVVQVKPDNRKRRI